MYLAALDLPAVDFPEGVDARPEPERPQGSVAFGQIDVYWEVNDPFVNEAPVAGSLSDDILDIYGDLRRGLDLWDRDVPKSAAIREWRFGFDAHWGNHVVDALRALHAAGRDAADNGTC